MTRHWTINGRFLAQTMTGVQRYAREIVNALDTLMLEQPDLARDLRLELLLPPDAENTLFLKAIGTRTVGRLKGYAWEQAVIPRHVADGLISLCNTGPLTVRRQILCIHDLNTRLAPASYSKAFRRTYRVLLPALGHVSRAIATVSNYSAGELVRHGICSPEKIFVAPDGHEHATGWKPLHSSRTLAAATSDTIVVIGSSIPHKNVGLILSMADRLAERGLRVAVVGASDPRVFNTSGAAPPSPRVLWLGRLSDAELAALLRDSMCLAFPSFVEGFGLPPLEAMAVGCPVVVSDRASLPEICGDAALYAAPDDADAWFECFMRLRHAPHLRSTMIAAGRRRLEHFRWRESAARYLDAMARMDGVASRAALNRADVDHAVA